MGCSHFPHLLSEAQTAFCLGLSFPGYLLRIVLEDDMSPVEQRAGMGLLPIIKDLGSLSTCFDVMQPIACPDVLSPCRNCYSGTVIRKW